MPDIANPFVKNLPQASLEQEKVATLKTEDGYSWDKDILLYLFYERDHNLINLISLYRCFVADKWTWIWDTNVLNSVKKGCKKLMKGTSSLTGAVTSSFWNSNWNSTMAPKVKKKLVWSALSKCLPTLVALYQKHVHVTLVFVRKGLF